MQNKVCSHYFMIKVLQKSWKEPKPTKVAKHTHTFTHTHDPKTEQLMLWSEFQREIYFLLMGERKESNIHLLHIKRAIFNKEHKKERRICIETSMVPQLIWHRKIKLIIRLLPFTHQLFTVFFLDFNNCSLTLL